MTDQPGRPPEERLPAPRPSSAPVPAERFAAPPSTHRNDLTPERAAKIVRQSANARWAGFLAVTIVGLFVIGYYFYELGLPGGLTQSRLDVASHEQQVTSVERGYNIYQANCAQCHGVEGQGGIGPTLNRQDKLAAHLSPEYLRNILEVGGRYACGDPNSIMPIWSNTGQPAGPLNYKQIEDLIAFIRAEQGEEYRVMDASLWEPVVNEATGEEETFQGWVDPGYLPAPGATPYPACWQDELTGGQSPAPSAGASAAPSAGASAGPSPSGSAAPGGSPSPSGAPAADVVEVSAVGIAFEQAEITAPADTPFTVRFDNKEAVPHNVEIKDGTGATQFRGDIVTGPTVTDYEVPGLPAGPYTFVCTVHPNMTGTLTVGS
jgi:mono/diheme cytochrome c family protein/plastocyanin